MLYGRKCRASICWDQVGERVIEGPEMIEVTNAKVVVAKEKLKEPRTHLSYVEEPEAILDRQDRVMRKKTILSSRFFGGTILSGKPLGKPRSLSGLLI
nr:putative reverse transcriptase domain-containing protein [Tanacetum cinerariifolium]